MLSRRHWAQINEATFVTGMKILFWIYRCFGHVPLRIAMYPVLICYLITQPAGRAASRHYLQRLCQFAPQLNIKPNLFNILRHFSAFAESLLDKMLIWGGLFKIERAEYEGQEHILNDIEQKRGGLFICTHLSNLELCRLAAKHCPGMKMTALIHTKHAQAFNRLLAQLDHSSQLNLMQVTEITPATAIALMEKVARGEFVAIAGDRIPVTPNPRVALADFLGERAPFPVGPYVLANLLQCPVYLMFSMRTRDGAKIYFEPFRELIQLPRKEREQVLTELVTEYAARLQQHCLQAPLQWFNFYDFWHFPTLSNTNEKH